MGRAMPAPPWLCGVQIPSCSLPCSGHMVMGGSLQTPHSLQWGWGGWWGRNCAVAPVTRRDSKIQALLPVLAWALVSAERGQAQPGRHRRQPWGFIGSGVGGCWVWGEGSMLQGGGGGVSWHRVPSSDDAVEALDSTFPACDLAAEGEGVLQAPPWGMEVSALPGRAGPCQAMPWPCRTMPPTC